MFKSFARAAVLAFAALCSVQAGATVYYVSDCQAGFTPGCEPGDDTRDGKSPDTAWRTAARVATAFGTLQAGDEVRFARGGSFNPFSLYIYNRNSRAATPIVLDAYTPPKGSASWPRPILIVPADKNGLDFQDGGDADHDEGYVVRNLDIRGSDSSSNGRTGIFLYNDVDHVLLDNLRITGFAIGVNCSESHPPNPGSDAFNEFITLRNSRIADNGVQGWLGGCGHVLIENNQFDNNGFAGPLLWRNHNIYMGSGHDITVRNNVLTRSAVGSGKCQGVALVAHGTISNFVIEGNLIDESTGAGDGCYGIQVTPGSLDHAESFAGTAIRANTIVNVGGNGISVGSCPDCVIENNRVVQMSARTFTGINMPSENIQVGIDAADTHLTVRNNTVYIAHGTTGSAAIHVGTYGQNHVVVSNLLYYGAGSTGAACFSTQGLVPASFTALDYNLCFNAGTYVYSSAYATLDLARAAGFDQHGLSSDPLFDAVPSAANNWRLVVSPNSPTIGAGHPTLSVTTLQPNIGAYPRWRSVKPKAPAGVKVR